MNKILLFINIFTISWLSVNVQASSLSRNEVRATYAEQFNQRTTDSVSKSELVLQQVTDTGEQNSTSSLQNSKIKASAEDELLPQTITFPEIPELTIGDPAIVLGATASSGLPITYLSSFDGPQSINGSILYNVTIGVFTVTAYQAGNDTYAAATPVQITLRVRPKKPIFETGLNYVVITPNSFEFVLKNETGSYIYPYYKIYVDDDKSFSSPTIFDSQHIGPKITGLATNKIYYYKVIAHYDNSVFSEPSETRTVGLGSVAINNDGNMNSLVENKLVASKIVINSNLVIDANSDIIVDTLEVNSSASLTVNSGAKLTIYGEIIVLSNADNEAGEISNNGTITTTDRGYCQFILRKTFDTGKWYFFGLPFTSYSITHTGTNEYATFAYEGLAVADLYVKEYRGDIRASNGKVSNAWAYRADGNPFTGAGRGYIFWSHNNATYDFKLYLFVTSENLNNQSKYNYVNQYAASEPTDMSWNLITSPYYSSVNLNHAVYGPYYVYNNAQDNYQVVMPGDSYNLPPYSAFFIQAQSSTLNFSQGGRSLMPKSVSNDYKGYEELNFSIANEQFSDLTRVRLQKGATAAYEIGSDAVKMYSMNNNVPQLFSKNEKTEFAVNTMPYETKSFDLFVKVGQAGKYSIALSDLNLAPNCTELKLVDKEKGTETNLLLNKTYSFNTSSAGTFNRFKVIVETVNDNVTTQIGDLDSHIKLLTQNNTVAFEGLESSAMLRVFDLSGKLLLEYPNIENAQFVSVPNKGLTILELSTSTKTYKLKTIIQ